MNAFVGNADCERIAPAGASCAEIMQEYYNIISCPKLKAVIEQTITHITTSARTLIFLTSVSSKSLWSLKSTFH